MICTICGEKNSDGAEVCRTCGSSLTHISSPTSLPVSTPTYSDYGSYYSKPYASQPKKKEKKTSRVEKLFNILFFILGFIFLASNLAVCFTEFLNVHTFMGSHSETFKTAFDSFKNFFKVTDWDTLDMNTIILNFTSVFIPFASIATAIIGTGVTAIVAVVKASSTGINQRRLHPLKIYVAISMAFVLVAMIIIGAFRSSTTGKYGKFVLLSSILSICFLVLQNIYQFILNIVKGNGAQEIKKSIFSFIETILFIVLVFTITGSAMVAKDDFMAIKFYPFETTSITWQFSSFSDPLRYAGYVYIWVVVALAICVCIFFAKTLGRKYTASIGNGVAVMILSIVSFG
ncbi:MAG: hypothetical protein K2O05_04365, partial [Anaeroplasmataceae bacterium]|nr:hypothetical protein [Anaeroplasmataceae bacterium]